MFLLVKDLKRIYFYIYILGLRGFDWSRAELAAGEEVLRAARSNGAGYF